MSSKWVKDPKTGSLHLVSEPDLCRDCIYFGPIVDWTRRKDGTRVEVHECDIHPRCLNTVHSVCCDDWTPVDLV